MIGTRFGVYEVTGTLGEGGMGQVYRATDTKLKRQVALKTLPPSFAADHDRLARFQREAEVLASLNHPHIAAIYGLEEYDGVSALVMELVEGEDLSQRIARGALPLDEALPIARQIAEALEAAHEQGIVHRDLKPANIKVRADGVAKVLDFGLAKALEPASTGASAPMLVSMSPTRLRPVDGDAVNSPAYTQLGVVLGTASYMSPEQARGRAVDKRSDIWAFGAVLYEMLTGTRAFAGEDVTDVIAAVVKDTPNWAALPADVPPHIVTLVQRCLDKDRKTRIGDIAVARFLLSDHASSAIGSASPAMRGDASRDRARSAIRTRELPWAVAVMMAVLAAALYLRPSPDAPLERVTFELLPPEGTDFDAQIRISPDGRLIAFAASGDGETRRRVWVRALDSLQARPLAGTEGTEAGLVWLPDNRTIVFASSGKLRKISATGGPAQPVCDFSGDPGGGFLTADNRIVFGTPATEGIQACPAGGGTATPITALEPGGKDAFHAFPSLLADGKHFLFWRRAGPETGIYLGSLDAKPEEQMRTRLLPDDSSPVYVPGADTGSGHVLFVRDGTLMAQRFDMRTLSLAGDAMPVAENVRRPMAFSASPGGDLVYLTGAGNTAQLTWFDRTGKSLGTVGRPGRTFNRMRIAPDGMRLAAARIEGSDADIWIVDLAQGTETRLTRNPGVDTEPVWSPDGRRIVFSSTRDGSNHLYVRAADGAGADELLLKTDERKFPLDWSSDGKWLLFDSMTAKGPDLWVLPMTAGPAGDRKPVPYLRGDAAEDFARFSPDGRWVAYFSNESGSDELYVRPFDPTAPEASGSGGGKVRVSLNGIDGSPRWEPDGRGLTYWAPDGKRWLVDVMTTPTLRVSAPRLLGMFPGAFRFENVASTPDNQRVLVAVPAGNQQPSATVILNWQAALRR